MNIPFTGGPYDGQSVPAALAWSRLVIFVACRKPRRRFAYLPRPSDWPALLEGRLTTCGPPGQHCYELVEGSGGCEFRHFPPGDDPGG